MYTKDSGYWVNAWVIPMASTRDSKYFIEEKKEVNVGIGSSSKMTFLNQEE